MLGLKLSGPNKSQKEQYNLALIGLGSNIEPDHNLPTALNLLSELTHLIERSFIWKSRAVGSSGPDYLNAAALIETSLSYDELKSDVLSVIETRLGRVRSVNKYMDRTIDLDVLVYNGREMDPELWTQAHVAVPAAQLLPDLRNTDTGETLAASAKRLSKKADLEKIKDLT
ncbi:MAG: 2-amino-4-hydroxy-6-hydroxymethyldihydropteridine diphosphokinase [Anaerolineales bacterium]